MNINDLTVLLWILLPIAVSFVIAILVTIAVVWFAFGWVPAAALVALLLVGGVAAGFLSYRYR